MQLMHVDLNMCFKINSLEQNTKSNQYYLYYVYERLNK